MMTAVGRDSATGAPPGALVPRDDTRSTTSMSAMNASINPTTLDAERRSHEPSMEEILASIRRIIADDDALPVIRREREKEKRPPAPAEAPKQADPRVAPPVAAPEPRRPSTAAPAPVMPAPETARPSVAALQPIVEAEPVADLAAQSSPPDDSDEFWLRGSQGAAEHLATDQSDEPFREQSRWAIDAEQDADAPDDDETIDEIQEHDHCEPAERSAQPEDEPDEEEASPALVSADAANSVASHFQALAASIVLSESDLIERYARDLLRPLLKQWLDDNLPHIVERMVRAEIERVARGRR
jgi:uncharacterized protein